MALDNENIHGADDLIKRLNAAKQYLKGDVFQVVGVEAVKLFKSNFQEEGFQDNGVKKWASRKTKRSGSTDGQKVLSKSGELAESIDYRIEGRTVIIITDKPYAEIHNEGGEISVSPKMKAFFWAKFIEARDAEGDSYDAEKSEANVYKAMALSKTIKMEKRQYMGESRQLIDNITNKVIRDLTRILKS